MAGDGWRTASLDELPLVGDDDPPFRAVRHALGLSAFGVNAWVGATAGDEVIEEHDELGADGDQEELYLVLAGRASFTVDGDEVDARTGTFVAVSDPALKRHALAAEDGTIVLAVGATRGRAFNTSVWEARAIEKGLRQ